MNSIFLLLDTTASTSSYALANNYDIIDVYHHYEAQEQAAVINILIEKLLSENQLNFTDLKGIIICAGPGSYTGMRISYSIAKGMCYALDIPLIAINKLDVWSHKYNKGHILTALKAREGEYFISENINDIIFLEPQHQLARNLNNVIQASLLDVVITDDINIANHIELEVAELCEISKDSKLDMNSLLELGLIKFANKIFEDIAYSEPMYLKGVHTTISKKKLLDI